MQILDARPKNIPSAPFRRIVRGAPGPGARQDDDPAPAGHIGDHRADSLFGIRLARVQRDDLVHRRGRRVSGANTGYRRALAGSEASLRQVSSRDSAGQGRCCLYLTCRELGLWVVVCPDERDSQLELAKMGGDEPLGASRVQARKADELWVARSPGLGLEVLGRCVVELGVDVCRRLGNWSRSLVSVEEEPRAVQSGRRRRAPFVIWDLASLTVGKIYSECNPADWRFLLLEPTTLEP